MSAISDPISDLLARVRNAVTAKLPKVDVPSSNMKMEIVKILKDEGFIKNYKLVEDNKQNVIRVYLKYTEDNKPAIEKLERISKPSRRVYVGAEDLKPINNNLGITILSTPKGVISNKTAKKENVGGELLCLIS
ncbi:MAG TPA: 30S ribosomal protein S8 [Spirochaetota bacterium]|jgi:small subunit ribosomal protein S8|nr:30S ribosomal protein S8 [Spirochaetota bacterium]HOR44025.1 30S ribosomal protein S8 [Spirochaetota bacterium]HOU84093.1 30S ribosomal protein S8 [Spirochaetota bacterium]HPK56314.1 30S ribosomal protein S8 [Spirochaetota bacterium]HQE58060.1 30S ribosomal protein S8 [Spirochaetota bacterium]